jgi:predicted nucleic acid-binding protein
MPKIVSNTTPIISLLKLNQLELLQKLYIRFIFQLLYIMRLKQEKQKDITKIYPELIG